MQPDQNQNVPLPQPPAAPESPNYGFIIDPQKPARRSFTIGSNPMVGRLVIALGGFLILLILFLIVKNLFKTPAFSEADYLIVIQQQQEILHILSTDLSTPTQRAALSASNQNFVVTSQLSIGSAQSQMLAYLKANNIKINPKLLDEHLDTSVDTELNNSLTTNNFNQEFDQVMQSEFQTYARNLSTAYNTSHGPKGRALLKSEYAGVSLLSKQLNSPAS